MHNEDSCYASHASSPGGPESAGSLHGAGRGAQRHARRGAAAAQPAGGSRALQRLRQMFHDDLLIRTPDGYRPTPKGQRLLQELDTALPRLDRLLSGAEFDPAAEETTFRIAATDHAAHVLCPPLCRTATGAEVGSAWISRRFTMEPSMRWRGAGSTWC